MKNITVYKASELQQINYNAFLKAYDTWTLTFDYTWHNDNIKVLNTFTKMFDLVCDEFYYDEFDYGYKIDFNCDDDILYLKGNDLVDYLKNVLGLLYNKPIDLTGYHMDYEILNPIIRFIDCPNNDITYNKLILNCIDTFFNACSADYAYCMDKDAFIEYSDINDLYYTIDGIRI